MLNSMSIYSLSGKPVEKFLTDWIGQRGSHSVHSYHSVFWEQLLESSVPRTVPSLCLWRSCLEQCRWLLSGLPCVAGEVCAGGTNDWQELVCHRGHACLDCCASAH